MQPENNISQSATETTNDVIDTVVQVPPPDQAPDSYPPKTPIWAILVFIIVLIIGGAGAYYLYISNQAQSPADLSPTTFQSPP